MRTPEWWTLSTAQLAVEALAILAFALSGVIEGARKRLDVVGVSVVAGLAAFGGGTLRDVLLDRRPLFWIEHPGWLWGVLALGIAAMLLMRARHLAPTERAMQWPDAIGLALFNASGLQIALAAGLPALNVPVEPVDGLPVGLQLIGPFGADRALLALGQVL